MSVKPVRLPLAPIKRIAESGGAQRIGMPAVEAIAIAAEEWIKNLTVSAEKYANHAGRKTIKPEDIIVVMKEQGISIQMPAHKKPVQKKITKKPAATVAPPAPAVPTKQGQLV